MKKFIYSLSILLSALAFTACSDFFDPETDDQLNGEDYISSDTEMYTGFLGIMTKLQAIGDKEILLTDTRAELLEITTNSTSELISLYNYDPDLQGNSYADPAPYYEVIMACNDYLLKMREYGKVVGVDPDVWADLVSSTIRVKAWTYKTIAEIYGEAVWFDSAVTELVDLTPANGFELLPIEQVMDRALALMENGWEGVPSDRSINWIAWLDPDKVTDIANSSFRQWNHMVPAYEGVYSELCLWKGAALDSKDPTGSSARPYYQKVCDLILPAINATLITNHGNPPYWIPSAASKGKWRDVFSNPSLQFFEIISVIIYDYEQNQNNSLNDHFLYSDRNRYLLAPSKAGMARWTDTAFNPGGKEDDRFNGTFRYPTSDQPVLYKYSVRSRTSFSDVHICTYRATQYHFYLVEALNHLGRYPQAIAILNNGVSPAYEAEDPGWAGFTANWTTAPEWEGSFRYPHIGIRGCMELAARKMVSDPDEADVTPAEAVRHNDMQMLDETLMEFACEGRTYAFMNRMALRYNDLNIVADRVAPKYEEAGMDGMIRSRILAGGNFVHYDLQMAE